MTDSQSIDQTNMFVKWNVEHPLTAKGISQKVQNWLKTQTPCTIVRLSDVYELDANKNAVRAAVYRLVANTPVFSNSSTRIAYGLRILADDTEAIITLPGLRVDWIALDYDKSYREAVKAKLDERSGFYARKLLFESLQKRSVDLISKEMKATRNRHNGHCKMCLSLNEGESRKASSCHLIHRVTVFWVCVDTIIQKRLDPLSEDSLGLLKQAIETNPYHSHPEYMIPLCGKHDRAVRGALKNVSHSLGNTDPEKCHFEISN